MIAVSDLQDRFRRQFGCYGRVFRAPGRVNLIGEHTDYNDGFVMPAAIDLHVWVAISPREDRKLMLISTHYEQTAEIDLDDEGAQKRNQWSDHIQGIAVTLCKEGQRLQGANLLLHGDVPIGAGLSSSAAVKVAVGFALLANSGLDIDLLSLAKLCRRVENEFVRARVGIMDPFACCFGQRGQAMLLDCRSLESHTLPLPEQASLVVCDTKVKHDLATGEYNVRRRECEEAVGVFSEDNPSVRALRDVNRDELEANVHRLSPTLYRRSRHVISENARVHDAARALERGELQWFGDLMYESHRSLRDDYQVSCVELDLMVDLASRKKGVYGARMMGGGFGGSTINLVAPDVVPQFKNEIAEEYQRATGIFPEIFVSHAADGVSEVTAQSGESLPHPASSQRR